MGGFVDPRMLAPMPFPGMGGAVAGYPGLGVNMQFPGMQLPGMPVPTFSMQGGMGGGGHAAPQQAPAPSSDTNNFKAAMEEINRQSRESWLSKAKQGGMWVLIIIVGFYVMEYMSGRLKLPTWLTGKPAESAPIANEASTSGFNFQLGLQGHPSQSAPPTTNDLVSIGGNIQVAYRENGTSLRYSVDHKNRTLLVFTPLDAITQAAMQQWQAAGYAVVIWQGAAPGAESSAISTGGAQVPGAMASQVLRTLGVVPPTGVQPLLTANPTASADVQKTKDAWEKLRAYLANRPGRFVDYEREALNEIITEGQGAARRASGEN